ncbi:hypothetical protein OH809_02295 [Streptomyces sp. NBC_00873]|uniref:glycoside hydrolase family 95-like protein n=1 Tax=unclassified Streptomyces TaxID=2593676 RepID=UPI00386EACC6|nr:hypothetical protein OH809_02295 [Streptomyces sp. NBC_00873]WTA48250.1 hypothetical protein OH821_41515 [Streptomyces sp. NBC_00842]
MAARGNFEVSATWSAGQAQSFEVLSKSGGELKLAYPKVGNAVVKTAGGTVVPFVKDASGDRITIATTAGQTYVVTSIPTHQDVAPPTGLAIGGDTGARVTLNWTASPNASSYSVYRAVGDEPGYTLLASPAPPGHTRTRACP